MYLTANNSKVCDSMQAILIQTPQYEEVLLLVFHGNYCVEGFSPWLLGPHGRGQDIALGQFVSCHKGRRAKGIQN